MTIWNEVALLPGAPPGDGRPDHGDVVHEVDGLRLLEHRRVGVENWLVPFDARV